MIMFDLNSKIELITEDEETTQGMIYDITDDKLYVSIMSDDKHFKLLYIGESLRCIVFDDLIGTEFDAIVTNRIYGDFPTYELSGLHNFNKIQRRQDVRIPCTIPVLYTKNEYLLTLDIESIESREIQTIKKYFKGGMMTDLSAGGLKFTSDENFNINQMFLLMFNIKDDNLFIKGKALYKGISVTPRKTFYTYGIKFIDISELQREKIISYLFVLMRRNRLK